MKLRTHPYRNEAITVNDGVLVRWALDEVPKALISTKCAFEGSWDEPWQVEIAPDGEEVAITLPVVWEDLSVDDSPACTINFRRWSDLQLIQQQVVANCDFGLTSLCFSPDGRLLLAADYRILLIERISGRVVSMANGNEYVAAAMFDPTSTYLSTVCTGQGGGQISVYKIEQDQLCTVHEALDRSGIEWPEPLGVDLADVRASIVFSPDGAFLAAYITSQWGAKTSGWQGEILLYEVISGRRIWHIPIDSTVLNGAKEASFYSNIIFAEAGNALICGTATGDLLVFNAADGTLGRRIETGVSKPISSLGLSADGSTVCVTIDDAIRLISLTHI